MKKKALKISKRNLGAQRLIYGFGWVSNGHYMVKQELCENSALFDASPEVVARALGIKESECSKFSDVDSVERIVRKVGGAKPFKVSDFTVRLPNDFHGEGEGRLCFSGVCEVLALDSTYCALLGIVPGEWVAATANGAAFSSPTVDRVEWVLMPMRYDMDKLAQALGEPILKALLATFEPERLVGGPGGNMPESVAQAGV